MKKILVFDDKKLHQRAAELSLKDYDLTVVSTYDEARKAFLPQFVGGKTVQPEKFDAVLVDLLVPASSKSLSPDSEEAYAGQEMPLGVMIAFLALSKGVKLVAVVTDTNHHNHPASAALDDFREVVTIGDARVILENSSEYLDNVDEATGEALSEEFLRSPEAREKYPVDPNPPYNNVGLARAKAWNRVLDRLLASQEK